MNKNDFNEAMKNLVSKELGEAYTVTLSNITKVNQKIPALNIIKLNSVLGSTIYLDQLYEWYQEQGGALEYYAGKILEVYSDGVMEEAALAASVLEMMENKESITDKIFYRIINRDNKELLMSAPHTALVEGSDLVMIYEILVSGSITSTITYSLMERLSLSEEEVITLARENTPRLFPAIFQNMTEILSAFLPPEERKEDLMWVLSNELNLNGASALLYEGVLDRIGERFSGSFYILPSSLHEVIVVKESDCDCDSLREIVQTVNQTVLETKDFLSNTVLYYDYTNHRLSVA